MDKHLMAVPVSIELFKTLIEQDHVTAVKCIKGLPPDARLVNSFYDGWRQTVMLIYEHPSFPLVQTGEHIMQFVPRFETLE